MRLLLDSFGRALLACLHPRVMLLSLLPLVLLIAGGWLLGSWYWDDAVALVRTWLETRHGLLSVGPWLDQLGLSSLKTVVAHLLVIFAVTPLLVMATLVLVNLILTPLLVAWVARQRFPSLARRSGTGVWASLWQWIPPVLVALFMLVLTLPLWLVPPMAVVLPALIGGWLCARLLTQDVLSGHASDAERQALLRTHRWPLLTMGLTAGLLSAGPGLLWASTALVATAFVVLLPLALWAYTLIFALTSLWFAHYALSALQHLRAHDAVVDVQARTLHDTSAP